MPKTKVEVYDKNQLIYPFIESDHVTFSNGMKVTEMLDQSISMPTVTHEDLSFKVGVGDQDVSSAIVDSSVSEMTIKGKTYQNILPEPSTHVLTNNKEMFKVNEGLDTNVEIVDGVSKSAILKGQTLVNLSDNLDTITRTLDWWYREEKLMDNIEKIKRNTYYTILYRLENLSGNHENYDGIGLGIGMDAFNKDLPGITSILDKNGGWCKIKFQLTDELIEQFPTYKQLHIRPIRRGTTPVEGESVDYTIRGFAILEGDYITNPIPFNKVFEGMTSVKAPVLKSVGKNLFDGVSYIDGFINQVNNFTVSPDNNVSSILVNVNKNTDYILSAKTTFSRSIVGGSLTPISIGTKTTNLNSERVGNTIKFNSGIYTNIIIYLSETKIDIEDIQVEEGSVATTYEPYKTNILSTPSDLELRGIGDVQDMLDCLTGEVTERIGEYIIDGSEDWNIYGGFNVEGYNSFVATITGLNNLYTGKNTFISGDIKMGSWKDYVGKKAEEMVWNHDPNKIGIKVKNETASNVEELKAYLASNPITFQYELVTPAIKTVDLSSSGNWEKVVLNGNGFDGADNGLTNTYRIVLTLPNAADYRTFNDGGYDNLISGTSSVDTKNMQISGGRLYIRIPKKDLLVTSVDGAKEYLRQNPVTVWYQTTVHQDSTQVKQPIFFADGHIIQSSGVDNSLIPTLDYQAKTSNSYVMDLMKTNTKYTMKAKSASGTFTIDGTSYGTGTNGTFTTPTSMTNKFLVMSNKTNEEVMILEGDVVSKTIPYFKGIKSTFEGEDKIEVLSAGKNLFDGAFEKGMIDVNGNLGYTPTAIRTVNYISVKPNASYHINLLNLEPFESARVVYVHEYDENFKVLGETQVDNRDIYISKSATKFIKINTHNANDLPVDSKMIVCENSTLDKQYEPYKSNSTKIPLLSPLRSLPNGVCDEIILDREKSKATLIQRVGELIHYGQGETVTVETKGEYHKYGFYGLIKPKQNSYSYNSVLMCDTFMWNDNMAESQGEKISSYKHSTGTELRYVTSPNRTPLLTESYFRDWLSRNPVTVYYELETPVVTEVDLEGFPYIYKDGHIFLNSEIVPTTEITYSINQCQQISASNEDIIRHEKELTYLQKLIAQYIQVDYESVLLSLKV